VHSSSLLVAGAAAVGTSLIGCGNTPPTAWNPDSVAKAWKNHFDAFGAQDLDKIMLDYDAGSLLEVFNDACGGGSADGVLTKYVGVAPIRGFFDELFTTLTPGNPGLGLADFGASSNPTVEEKVADNVDSANVFLVWTSVAQGIEKATDTFLFKIENGAVRIRQQTIVTSHANACPSSPPANPSPKSPPSDSLIKAGWDNHFKGFGDQDKAVILADYTESSVVQIYSWGGRDAAGYSKYEGLTAIGNMFDTLWSDMNAQTVNGTDIGLGVPSGFPRVDHVLQSVFLTWFSYSNPKATDTFLFDAAGKITRQTIVTTTGVAPSSEVIV